MRLALIIAISLFGTTAYTQTNVPQDSIVVKRLTEDANMIQFNPLGIDYLIDGKPSPDQAIFQGSFVKSTKAPFLASFFTLWFHSTSHGCKYPTNFTVRLRAGNDVFEISSDPRNAKSGESASTFSEPEGRCVESLWVHLRQDTFLKIANAKDVTVHLGALVFRLRDNHLAAMRQLARQI